MTSQSTLKEDGWMEVAMLLSLIESGMCHPCTVSTDVLLWHFKPWSRRESKLLPCPLPPSAQSNAVGAVKPHSTQKMPDLSHGTAQVTFRSRYSRHKARLTAASLTPDQLSHTFIGELSFSHTPQETQPSYQHFSRRDSKRRYLLTAADSGVQTQLTSQSPAIEVIKSTFAYYHDWASCCTHCGSLSQS